MPPSEMTATSVVPPPMSTTMFPPGSATGRSAPIAPAIGSSITSASRAPAVRVASFTARSSTSVIPLGTQRTTRRWTPLWPSTLARKRRSICSVTSKSAITPCRSGRVARIDAGVRPIIRRASAPTAYTRPVSSEIATTDGSKSTIPRPRMKTSVLAVPRSTAMSRPPPNDPQTRIAAPAYVYNRPQRGNRRPDPVPRLRDLVPGRRERGCGRARAAALPPRRAGSGLAAYEAVRGARRGAHGGLLRPARRGQLGRRGASRPGDVDSRVVRRGGGRGAGGARPRPRTRPRPLLGRDARDAVCGDAALGAGVARGRELAAERPGLDGRAGQAARRATPGGGPDVAQARGGGDLHRPGVRGGGDGLLQAPPLPDRPLARLAGRVLRSSRCQSRGLPPHERALGVPRDRDDQGLGHHAAARADRGSDAPLLRPLRRGDAGKRGGCAPRDPRLRVRGARGELAHGPGRGAGADVRARARLSPPRRELREAAEAAPLGATIPGARRRGRRRGSPGLVP